MSMSVTKNLRGAVGGLVLVSVLVTGCAGSKAEKNKPGQTGEPKVTTTTEATTTTTEAVDDEGSLETPADDSGDGVKIVDGLASDANTIQIIGGTFQPSTKTIQVGEKITFKGKNNIAYQLTVGSVAPSTVTEGLVETYQFDKPGTITVSQDYSGDTATITVEGDASATTTTATTAATGSSGDTGDTSATTVVPDTTPSSTRPNETTTSTP